MNMFKRFLALSLVLCMVLGFTPANTFAAEETGADSGTVETIAPEAEAPVQEETPAEALPSVQEEAPAPDAELLALTQKPADGKTKDQPFNKGTGGSGNFRIPGIVALDNGRLVASSDARWNHTGDGAGLDTIVSWSDDNGHNWHYTFANYLGDNGNTKNVYSTSFIDPAIATDGKTVYMIADLFPAGIALNTSKWSPVAGKNGLDDQGRLLLRAKGSLDVKNSNYASQAASAKYDYYLENGKIYQKNGTEVSGYTVDDHFNITSNSVSTNLFCADSPFQPYPTNYLYLTSSTDGQNWSAPQLLNLKEANEQTLLVGPGNGTYDSKTGNMIFTAYEHTSGTECTSLIWMDSKGNWHRSADANFVGRKSSEASAVVLADGTVRVFYRNNSNNLDYTDFTWDGSQYVPGNTGKVAKASKTQNNQLSVIKYSRQADGKDLILVSTAVGSGTSRVDGHIYAISVDTQNNMTLLNSYDVVSGSSDRFDYSCMTEVQNGDIAILYENNVDNGEITFKTIAIQDIVGQGVQLGEPNQALTDEATQVTVTAPGLTGLTVKKLTSSTPATGYNKSVSYEITLNNAQGKYTGPATVKLPAEELTGCISYVGHVDGEQFNVSAPVNGSFTVKVPHFSIVTISGADKKVSTDTIEMFANDTVTKNQNDLTNELTSADIKDSNPGIVDIHISSTSKNVGGKTEYTIGTNADITSLKNGESMQIVIASGNDMLVSNGAGKFANAAKTDKVEAKAVWTITKNGEFYQISQQIDGKTYYLYRSNHTTEESGNTRTYRYTLQVTNNPVENPNWRYDGGFYQNQIPGQKKKSFFGVPYWENMPAEPFYLTPSWSMTKTTNSAVDVYSVTSQEVGGTTIYDHSITFTGKQAGHSTVTIGDVVYDVTVKNQQKTINLTIGQQATFPCNGDIIAAPDSKIATAVKSGSELVITGVSEGTTKVVAGGVEYTVNVTKVPLNPGIGETPFVAGTGAGANVEDKNGQHYAGPVTKLTLSKDLTFDLNLKDGQTGTNWRIGDPSIADVDQSGVVRGKQPGETRVYVTINGVEHSIPVVVKDTTATNNDRKIFNFYTSEITDTTVYYILNNDSQLHEVIEGEAIYVSYPNSTANCINFFGAPKEGYALTRMSATNSDGAYFVLHTGDHKTINTGDTGFVNGTATVAGQKQNGAGKNQQANWGNGAGSQLYNSVQKAIDAMCDGGMGWTRNANASKDADSTLTFRSEKLPTINKTVRGVLGTDNQFREYVPGMTAVKGEKVYYQITVDKYASQDAITYTNVQVKDILNNNENAKLEIFKGNGKGGVGQTINSNPFDITAEITGNGLNADTHTYFVAYTITDADLDTTLVNKADLTYRYQSKYSSGAFDASAKAEAKITATSFVPKDIVIDFGLPVTVHYEKWGNDSVKLAENGHTANYGTVTAVAAGNGWDVTYTPTKVMQGVDTVTLKGTNGAEYSFKVYPATTVLYEEGFATLTGFTGGSKGSGKQETQLTAETGKNSFGYDGNYAAQTGMSNGTQIESAKLLSTASFTFTGTGMDLYANCDTSTGAIAVKLKQNGKMVKYYQVDTVMAQGVTDVTGSQNITAYSLPVVSVRDLPHGTYEVTVQHIAKMANDQSHVMLDGFRVYNTLNDLNNAAYPASEKNPGFTELRDVVLTGLKVGETDTGKDLVDQVFTKVDTTKGAVVLANGKQYTQDNVNDLLNNGPKNELFLYPNQAVTFKLANGVNAQIGLKAVNGTVTYGMQNGTKANTTHTISTSTDMFYHDGLTGAVTITNKSGGILSVTLVKHFGSAAKVFAEVTEQQMARALFSLGYQDPTALADATLNVSLTDWSGKEIAAQSIVANGLKGDAHTFTAEEIRAVVSQLLPAGYALVDDSAVADTSVVYGENGQVKIQIGQTATLQVSYVKRVLDLSNIFHGSIFTETVVGTAEFSAVQTDSNGSMTVSADELRKAAPEGYRLGRSVRAQSVPFGTEKALKLIVR